MLLPSLVFGSQIERSGVLEVRWKHDGLVSGFARKLNSEIPRIEGNEGEVEALRNKVFASKGIEPVDSITEGSCVTNMLPSQSCQARCGKSSVSRYPTANL